MKVKHRKMTISEKDFLLASRRASRLEEIEAHGKQISFRSVTHKSKKAYNRRLLRKGSIIRQMDD